MTDALRRRRPSLEALESRHLPATFGIPWPDPQHLTISFMPDGTSVAGGRSALFQTLDSRMPAKAWEAEILSAFEAWAALTNVDVSVVPDDGAPAGLARPEEGESGYGDIRIGSRPLSPDTLSLSVPFTPGDPLSGVVLLNTQDPYSLTPGAPNSLAMALVHEAGHVLGLPDNPGDTSSVMYDFDTGANSKPDAQDAAHIQALYGTRATPIASGIGIGESLYAIVASEHGLTAPGQSAPSVAPAVASKTQAGAIVLNPVAPGTDARWSYLVDGTVSPAAPNAYVVTAGPSHSAALVATVWDLKTGSFSPRITVLDASGHAVATQVIGQDAGADETVQILSPTPGARYTIDVSATAGTPFHSGGYALAVAELASELPGLATIASGTLTAAQPGQQLTLNVADAELFNFSLSGGTTADSAVTYTILNATNQAIYQLRALGGAGVSTGNVLLPSGVYTVRIIGTSQTRAPLSFTVLGDSVSDPIGPKQVTTTTTPAGSGSTPPYSTATPVTISNDEYLAQSGTAGGSSD